MPIRIPLARLPLLALALGFLLLAPRASAEEGDFREARKTAKALMDQVGEAGAKRKAVEALAALDSAEAADLLVEWHVKSAQWEEKELGPAFEEAFERLDKYEAMLRKSIGDKPPTDAKQVNALNTLKKAVKDTRAAVDAEEATRHAIEDVVKRMGAAPADWFMQEGLPQLRRKDKDETIELRVAIARCLIAQPFERVRDALLATAGSAGSPKEQAVVFAALAEQKSDEGFDHVVAGLRSQHVLVRRSAVYALREYSQPRAVPALIQALERAKAFEAQEIEEVLHWYTGQSFNAVARIWKTWWDNEGTAWSEKDTGDRHPPQKREHAGTGTRTTFYDIPTESQAIVFVLDRSGSMTEPAGEKAREKDDKPKGPVTGGGGAGGKGDADEAVGGETRMEVAKNKLAQCVAHLAKDVRFALVFYSSDVVVWKEAPAMEPASAQNKEDATRWFMELKPQGATLMFDALLKALEYADSDPKAKGRKKNASGGANTIFLLSDGAPTDASGQPSEEVTREGMARFLEANQIYRCVVHTIGIGPKHNRTLMQQLAAATGGEYRAAGVE
ncbi:MAG: VWA domain-containing protein [Planctomycetota bacterium]